MFKKKPELLSFFDAYSSLLNIKRNNEISQDIIEILEMNDLIATKPNNTVEEEEHFTKLTTTSDQNLADLSQSLSNIFTENLVWLDNIEAKLLEAFSKVKIEMSCRWDTDFRTYTESKTHTYQHHLSTNKYLKDLIKSELNYFEKVVLLSEEIPDLLHGPPDKHVTLHTRYTYHWGEFLNIDMNAKSAVDTINYLERYVAACEKMAKAINQLPAQTAIIKRRSIEAEKSEYYKKLAPYHKVGKYLVRIREEGHRLFDDAERCTGHNTMKMLHLVK